MTTHKINDFQYGTHYHIEKHKLDNDLNIILFQDASAPTLAYHTWFHVGSRNERDGITGIAHFFEHLMFKETSNYPEGAFDRMLEEAGGKINAATYLDWTFYRESVPKESLDLVCKLESDRMQNVILNQTQLDSEREVVANERRFRVDNNPSGLMYEALYKNAFERHSYHWPVIGWMKDIESISLDDCMTFYKQYYAPNNATVVVVGDFEPSETLETIAKYYQSIPSSNIEKSQIEEEPEQTKEKTTEMSLELSSPRVVMGYRIPNATDPDMPTLELLHTLLFHGRSSRLYRRLVHTEQLATHASGWVNHTKDPGLFIIDIMMKQDKEWKKALDVVDEEIQKVIKDEISQTELNKCKTKVETSFWQQLKTNDDKAQTLGFHELVYKDYRRMFDEIQDLSKVTSDDLKRAAQNYLTPNRRTVVAATPKKGS